MVQQRRRRREQGEYYNDLVDFILNNWQDGEPISPYLIYKKAKALSHSPTFYRTTLKEKGYWKRFRKEYAAHLEKKGKKQYIWRD